MNKKYTVDRNRLNITNIGIDPVDVAGAAQRIASLVNSARANLGGAVDNSNSGDGSDEDCGDYIGDFGSSGGGCKNRSGSGTDNGCYNSDIQSERLAAYVCTPNAEFMMDAQNDALFMQILNEADLVVADGAGVVLAARLLGYGKINRAPGFDLAKRLVTNPAEYPFSFYFLGCKPGVAEKAAANIIKESPDTRITGWHDGYFNENDEPGIIEDINNSKADVLYVALGAPKAEKWIYKNRSKLRVSLCIGVGGTLDAFAGEAKLAPPFYRAHGLEWLYRLMREPWRIKRMMKLPHYVFYTIWWRLAGCPGK